MTLKNTRSSMGVLLFDVLLAHLGTYMVLPLIPIFLKVQKGMTVGEIGLILAVSPFTFQIGSVLGGYLSDRIGRRSVIALGAWINAVALVGYGIFNELYLFIGIALLSGLGVGLNAPATKAAIAVLASQKDNETTAFSLRGIAANIGISIAGLLTFFVLGGASSLVFYVAAGLFIFLGAISWLLLPKGCGDEPCQTVPLKSYKEILRNKAFLGFSVVSIFIWALYTQLSLSVPLRAEDILPDPSVVSLIWTINSIIVIFMQTPISRWVIERSILCLHSLWAFYL
jgi:MFS family permease